MKKRIFSILLALVMALSLLPTTALADSLATNGSNQIDLVMSTWPDVADSGFASGSGTETDPYVIETAEQLAYLAKTATQEEHYYQ